MGRGRPLADLVLSVRENNQLVEGTRRGKTSQALALRARIVLGCGIRSFQSVDNPFPQTGPKKACGSP